MKAAILKFYKHRFLLSQLVSRDFKVKYKRSVLGVLWSTLNPLLTMCVQYIVFSELFRWDIDNFAVYLLIGTVLFNFLSESTQQALVSITGNVSLITKVAVPVSIFPISKVLSSCINLGFSMIALYAILFFQQVPLNFYHLMLPFVLVCLIMFCIGLGLILSAMMVYFRDIQFLYGIVIVLWMYLTPLFYPIDIIPDHFMPIIQCNPMYYYVLYARTIILGGTMPNTALHLFCLMFALVFLLIGILVFRKAEKNFILNI